MHLLEKAAALPDSCALVGYPLDRSSVYQTLFSLAHCSWQYKLLACVAACTQDCKLPSVPQPCCQLSVHCSGRCGTPVVQAELSELIGQLVILHGRLSEVLSSCNLSNGNTSPPTSPVLHATPHLLVLQFMCQQLATTTSNARCHQLIDLKDEFVKVLAFCRSFAAR